LLDGGSGVAQDSEAAAEPVAAGQLRDLLDSQRHAVPAEIRRPRDVCVSLFHSVRDVRPAGGIGGIRADAAGAGTASLRRAGGLPVLSGLGDVWNDSVDGIGG